MLNRCSLQRNVEASYRVALRRPSAQRWSLQYRGALTTAIPPKSAIASLKRAKTLARRSLQRSLNSGWVACLFGGRLRWGGLPSGLFNHGAFSRMSRSHLTRRPTCAPVIEDARGSSRLPLVHFSERRLSYLHDWAPTLAVRRIEEKVFSYTGI